MKAATAAKKYPQGIFIFQSTPPVKAATVGGGARRRRKMISIHAAREGGDLIRVPFRDFGDISIHAAREGGDEIERGNLAQMGNFNPRRP